MPVEGIGYQQIPKIEVGPLSRLESSSSREQ
jgi:hypothetical protein